MKLDEMQDELKNIILNCKKKLEETLNSNLVGKKLYQVKTDRHGESFKPIYKGIVSNVEIRDLDKYNNSQITINTERDTKKFSIDTYLREINDSKWYGYYVED